MALPAILSAEGKSFKISPKLVDISNLKRFVNLIWKHGLGHNYVRTIVPSAREELLESLMENRDQSALRPMLVVPLKENNRTSTAHSAL